MNLMRRMSAVVIMTCLVSACGGQNSDSSSNSGPSIVNVAKTLSEGPTGPAISMTNNGRAVAVWSLWSSSSSSLWVNHYTPESGWGIANRLGGSGTGREFGAKVAVNSSGNCVLAWKRQINSSKEIMAAVYHSASGWSAPTVLDSTEVGASDITVLMDENGIATVFWQRTTISTYTNTSIMTSRHTANGWDAPQVFVSSTSTTDQNFVGNSSGQIMAIWQQFISDPNDMFSHNVNSFVRMLIPASGWLTAQPIGNNIPSGGVYFNPTTTPGHYTPRISLDNQGNALALWSEAYYPGDSYHITVNAFAAVDGWGEPQAIGTIASDSTLSVSPFVSDSSATSYVSLIDCYYSWDFDFAMSNIFVVAYKPGIGWTINKVIESLPFYCLSPRITVGKNDSLYLTWLQIDGNDIHLWSKQYSSVSGWGSSRRFDDWSGDVASYETASDSSGNTIVIWSQDSGDSWATLAKPLD